MVIAVADVSVAVNGDIRWEDSGDIGIVIAFNENTDTYTDDTTDANEATINDVLLPPFQTTILGDYTAFGHTQKFSWVNVKYDTAADITGGTGVWQYYDGTTWSTLTVVDGTAKFVTAATTAKITFDPPSDWAVTTIDTTEGFFIRLYYSAAPSVITTAPLGSQLYQNVGTGTPGAANAYTVLELHRFLQDLADNPAYVGTADYVDITTATPSERSTDNIITLNSPFNIDDCLAQHLYDGSITQAGGDDVYSGLVVVGSLYGTTTLQVVQDNKLYNGDAPWWGTGQEINATANILNQVLIRTRVSGTDIDGKRVRIFAREWSETYAEFSVTMGLGNAVAAIFTNNDLNNQTAIGTVLTWTGITNTEGYQTIDLDNGDGAQPYYSKWDYGTKDTNDVYERTKWLSRRGTDSTIHSMDGELFRGITHQWNYDGEAVSEPVEDEVFSWGSGATAGTGALLALLDNGDDGTMWIQLLTGVPPTDPMTLTGTSTTTVEINGSVTSRSLTPQFFGTSTGTAIIGGFGIGIDPTDANDTDTLFDLANQPRTPPNLVDFYVYGIISGDYVLVTPEDGAAGLDYDQSTTTATYDASGVNAIVVAAIPVDTPGSGSIRVALDDGRYRKVAYSAWDTLTYTVSNEDFTAPDNATSGNNVFISYIDLATSGTQETFQTKYWVGNPRTLFIRVRDGGGTPIKTYEGTAVNGSAGGSATANRISDE